MPTLSDLKAVMEQALGDPGLLAEVYARPLRKAGLLTTGGRGLSAPDVTVTDCANLLIAIMGHGAAIESPETVTNYRGLVLLRRPVGKRGHRNVTPRKSADLSSVPLEKIREVHYLGEAIELLIWRAADGSLKRLQSRWTGILPEHPGLSLRLTGPTPAATLRLPMLGEKTVLAYAAPPSRRAQHRSGLVRAAEVHEDAVLAVARLFAS